MILPITNPRELPKNQCVQFYDTDTEELYEKNLNKYGTEWKWAQQNFNYQINSLGYRMKEFDQLDWKNYMAVFGCSFTVGVGLPLEETFSYKISQDLALDLANLAIAGGNNDLVLINLTRILSNNLPPKLVIVNWTSIVRKSYWVNNIPTVYLPQLISDADQLWVRSFQNRVENFDQLIYEFQETKQQVDLLCKLANVPVWHITNYPDYYQKIDIEKIYYDLNCVDYSLEQKNQFLGRDIEIHGRHAHPGIELQNRIVHCWNKTKHTLGFI